jgi:peptide/nickel transport system permease protein
MNTLNETGASLSAGSRVLRVPSLPRGLSPLVVAAMLVVFVVIVAAVAGAQLAPHSATAQDLNAGLTGPSADHWLGTDDLGRDVFSRTIVGARSAVLGPLIVAFGAMLIGNLLGLLAGFRGGWVDTLVSRYADLVYAFPALLVAVVIVGVVGGGYFVAVGLLVVLYSPVDTRLIRSATLVQRSQPYVEAARVSGVRPRRIMLAHIWPNVLPLAVANAFLTFAFSIVSLASLSFLGLGVGPGAADWGRMLSDSRTLLFDNPWTALGPGVAVVVAAASVNILGDWLFEQLSARGGRR